MEDCCSFLFLLACQDGCNFSSFDVVLGDVLCVGFGGAVVLCVK